MNVVALALVGSIGLPSAPNSAVQDDEPLVVELRAALVLEPVGERRRAATYTDALELARLETEWNWPDEGEAVVGADGTSALWQTKRAGDDGWLAHRGWVLFTYDSPQERVMLLEASGHSMVYVNDAPRVGDPYRTGFVRLPVRLREGANRFLFSVRRGGVRARLLEPTSRALLHLGDRTVPDLIVGERGPWVAALVVMNMTPEPLAGLVLEVDHPEHGRSTSDLPRVSALSVRKVPFRIGGPARAEPGDEGLTLTLLERLEDGRRLIHDRVELSVRVRRPSDHHNRTFESAIDGSVQYFSVRPAASGGEGVEKPALVLTLHGAGVEASRQAACYRSRPWCHVVAPTNRRHFGFDWEDWGRLDALEVLELARGIFDTDDRRTYLTGHSMGGHGTWNLGAHYPDRFAAIGPSAGWISFWSYTGAPEYGDGDPAEAMLARARAGSDTLSLSRNYAQQGIYVLHGDRDDNVPVAQARTMREHLAGFHANFAYYERPGAGHWWGNQCMDWPPLFDFLRQNEIPDPAAVRHLEFTTVDPGISARCHWLAVEAQIHAGRPSRVEIDLNSEERRFHGVTENISRLTIDLAALGDALAAGSPLVVALDDVTLEVPWPEGEQLHMARDEVGAWVEARPPDPARKGPHRSGPFKDVFRHRFLLVYGTQGGDSENAWARNKARFDAETFWYRGNGACDIIADREFDASAYRDRSVVLYGNARTNGAWSLLLDESPVQVRPGGISIGDRRVDGDDLACLFIRPRPGSDVASVGVVGGTGLAGMRLTDRLGYFVSGIGYPDLIVIGSDMLSRGTAGIRAAGFFGEDWSVDAGEFVYHGR